MNYKFMRLVVNALYIIMMQGLGYDMRGAYHTWELYKDDFLTELNTEDKK